MTQCTEPKHHTAYTASCVAYSRASDDSGYIASYHTVKLNRALPHRDCALKANTVNDDIWPFCKDRFQSFNGACCGGVCTGVQGVLAAQSLGYWQIVRPDVCDSYAAG